jgi:hypothetical protein
MNYEYSEAEIALFRALGQEADFSDMNPLMLYNTHAILAFVNNKQGYAVDSLRRCLQHLSAGKPRLTPEFDHLIRLEGHDCRVPGCMYGTAQIHRICLVPGKF